MSDNSKAIADIIAKTKSLKSLKDHQALSLKTLDAEFKQDCKTWLLELMLTMRADKSKLSNKWFTMIFNAMYPKFVCRTIALSLFSNQSDHAMNLKYRVTTGNNYANVKFLKGNMTHVSHKYFVGHTV